MKFVSRLLCGLFWSRLFFAQPAFGQPAEVVPQVALPGAAVLVADDKSIDKSKTPRFLPGETIYSQGGALQWRTSRGEILKTIAIGGVNSEQSIAIKPAPNGELVATFSTFDKILRWKNAWTGETVREFPNEAFPFEFSDGGTRFASTSAGKIIVREVPSGRDIAEIESPVASSNSNIAFSPNGAQLVVYRGAKPLEVFETASGRKIFDFDDAGRIFQVHFLPGGLLVASRIRGTTYADSFVLRRLDSQGREMQKQEIKAPNTNNLQFRFAGDAVFLEAGYEKWSSQPSYFAFQNGTLSRISTARWNALTPKPLPTARLGAPVSLRFAGAVAGKTLASDGSHFWNGATGKLEFSLAPVISNPTAFDVARDAKSLAVAGSITNGKMVGVWSRAPLKLKNQRVKTISGRIETSDFSQSGEVWASDLQFSPDGRLLAIASGLVSQAPPLIVQDAASGHVLWQWKWGEEFNGWGSTHGTRIEFAPDGKSLIFLDNILQLASEKQASPGNYGRLRRADPLSGEVTTEMQTLPSFALDFAPDGNSLAVSTQKGELKRFDGYSQFIARAYALELRDPQSLELRRSIAAPLALEQIRWSPDGQKIVALGDDTSLYLLDVAAEKWTKLAGHAQVPRDVKWLSATKLASCGEDGRLVFWNAESGEMLGTTTFFRPDTSTQNGAARSQKVEFVSVAADGSFTSSRGALPFVRLRENGKLKPRTIRATQRKKAKLPLRRHRKR